MARLSKSEREAQIHAEALRTFDDIQAALRDERQQCVQDRRFYSICGAQWEGSLQEQYENKPKFEVNKVHLSVMRIINEYRNNRITVDFMPKDGATDESLADTCDKLFRADEQDSSAEEAYDNAFEEAVGGGFGAFRLRATDEDEEDEENERQRVRIEPIYDADTSVFFDLDAKRQDKADATQCFVMTSMTPDAYKERFDDDPTSWPEDLKQTAFDWATPDVVYVAEYYKVEEVGERLRIYRSLDGEEVRHPERDFEDDLELETMLLATGHTLVRERRIKRRKVHKWLMSGGRILEDMGLLPGNQIPVIPVYGKRWFIDNVERCMGHVRLAKDAQRLKNMQLSKLGEISALTAVEKPIFTPEQVAGLQEYWRTDNVSNYPYLLVNPITNADGAEQPQGPLGYTKPPAIPPAMAALLQLTDADMKELLGAAEAAEEVQQGMSGKAVELIQNRLDMQSYIYMSNMSKAVKRAGEVWLSMARDIYVEPGRRMKALTEAGDVGSVELARPILDEAGAVTLENDLSRAKFDVTVSIGPTSTSRRAATVRALTGMMTLTQDPETLQVLSSMVLMNLEGEGMTEARKYFRKKLLRMGVVEPTEKEAAELQAELQQLQSQPDANTVLAQSLAAEAQAKAQKAQADTELALARSEEARAKTADTLAGIDIKQRDSVLNAVDKIRQAGQPLQSPER
jgi:hypothetical protein